MAQHDHPEQSLKKDVTEIELGDGQVTVTGIFEMPLKRQFNILTIIAVGYNMSNSWVAIAASFAIAIQSGGALSLLYGIITIAFTMLCTGLTLAELASVYPTAGGQYHFASILAPARWSRGLSYFTGLAAIFAWLALVASICMATTSMILAISIRWSPTYEPQAWHYFLVYEAFNAAIVLYNVFLTNKTLWIYNFGFLLSLSTFIIITIACPSRASQHADSASVWTEFVNGSNGWPDGISYLTSLTTPQFMLSGLDATLHLAEECLQPERIVPKAVLATVIIGFLTAFPFAIAVVYSSMDVQASLSTPTGFPIYYIWEKATRSPAAGTAFMCSLLVISCIAFNAVHQTASRLTWSFARDEGLFFSNRLVKIHSSLGVPVLALLLNGALVGLVGVLNFSATAFNSFINTCVIVAQVSFAVPALILIVRRRPSQFLPPKRKFKLPSIVGYVSNAITVIWAVILLIFFCFPAGFPVTGENMNYTSVVMAIMAVLGVINWFTYARKWYHGPRLGI